MKSSPTSNRKQWVFALLLALVSSFVSSQTPPNDGNDYCCDTSASFCRSTSTPFTEGPNECLEDCGQTCLIMDEWCSTTCGNGSIQCLEDNFDGLKCCDATTGAQVGQCFNSFPDQCFFCWSFTRQNPTPTFSNQKKYCCNHVFHRRKHLQTTSQSPDFGSCFGSCDPNCVPDRTDADGYQCKTIEQHCHGASLAFQEPVVVCGDGDHCCFAATGQRVGKQHFNQFDPNDYSKSFDDWCLERPNKFGELDGTVCQPVRTGRTWGDPHFQTWAGTTFDYHSECDLVFLKVDNVHDLSLDIHIRTKRRYDYSYIETAAVKLGDDIVEVSSFGEFSINGVSDPLTPFLLAQEFTLTHTKQDTNHHTFDIDLTGQEHVVIKVYKDMVNVKKSD